MLLVAATCGAFATLAPGASAQYASEDQGVTAARGKHGQHVLRFSREAARVYRRLAGRRVAIGCSRLAPSGKGYVVDTEATTIVRAPRRRSTLSTGQLGRADLCSVRRTGRADRLIAMAPVTDRGRIFIEEAQAVGLMLLPLLLTDDDLSPPPPVDRVVAQGRGFVVALAGPDAGYWTDGTRSVVAAVSKRGRRLFFESDGDVVRTNVLSYLTGD
jgi:hypothetical protein